MTDATEKENRDAIVAKLNAPFASKPYAFTVDQIKAAATLPSGYAEVYVTERQINGDRAAGRGTLRGWRVQVRAVGTTDNNAAEIRARVRTALEDVPVTVGGQDSTPLIRGLSDDPIGPDGTYYSGLSEWVYSL